MVVWFRSDLINSKLAFIFSVILAVYFVGMSAKDRIFIWILSETITIVIAMTGWYIAKQAILENPKALSKNKFYTMLISLYQNIGIKNFICKVYLFSLP
jgi:hypothetical protein